ncbi:IS5 family transposase [Streptomyces sp. NPDC048430]|uniref:IS5 family transposase n=1 Tax=Streptomyces sp. NPDC048430 TaxID=3155388 RepID=UPI00344865D0
MSLSNAQWARIEPLLPDRTPRRGGRWRDHRQVIDAIAFKYRTGIPWMDLPEHFGSWKGVHNRPRKWAADGTWKRIFTTLLAQADAGRSGLGRRGRLHDRSCSPARGRGPQKGPLVEEPNHHAMGRSRGGLTTKIHLAADSRCRPLAFVLTPGQAGDAPAFPEVMAGIRVPRPVGRPRTTPTAVLADKAYSSRAIRTYLRHRGIRAVIPQPVDQTANRKRLGSRGGRPPAFTREAYKQRNTVERCINKIKQWRGLATRYDKTATIYLAALHLAGIFIWSAR